MVQQIQNYGGIFLACAILPLLQLIRSNLITMCCSIGAAILLRKIDPGHYDRTSGAFRKVLAYHLVLSRLLIVTEEDRGSWLTDWLHAASRGYLGLDLDSVGSTFWGVPQQLSLGDDVELSDDVMLLTMSITSCGIEVRPSRVENDVFIGNSSVLAPGSHVKQGALLGMLSYLQAGCVMEPGSSWFGNPAVPMGGRYQSPLADDPDDLDEDQDGSFVHTVADGLLAMSDTAAMAVTVACVSLANNELGWLVTMVPVVWLGLVISKLVVTWAIKWRIVGRISEGEHSAESPFCADKALVDLFTSHVSSTVLRDALGTPIITWWYRALGATIGAGCWINTPFISEPDLAVIGSSVSLAEGCEVQSHLFEDRVLRLGTVRLCDGATLHCEAVAVMNSTMMPLSELYPLSVPLPGEQVPGRPAVFTQTDQTGTGSWIGNPLQQTARFHPSKEQLGLLKGGTPSRMKEKLS